MIAVGAKCYSHGSPPSTGSGRFLDDVELSAAINGHVSALVLDDIGKADLQGLLAGVTETSFEQDQLAQALAAPTDVEDWRVGEAVAEAYLAVHRGCMFPWPDSRDERKSGSSLPGADLVGLQHDERGDRFVFGEVKTSGEAKYPPGAVYGRTGLKQQLDDLRDKVDLRNDLFRYLGHRAINSTWVDRFKAAAKRYLNSTTDVQLFGVLVRDVDPNVDDVRVRVEKLGKGCPSDTMIELVALYLPIGAIGTLAKQVLQVQVEGGA